MTVFKFAMMRNFRNPVSFLITSATPIVLMFIMADAWREVPPLMLGMLVFLMMFSAYLLAALILEDRVDGSIIRVQVSPTTTFSYVVQNLLASILPLVLQMLLLGTLGYFRYNWSIEFTLGLTLSMLLFALANTAFAFCWNMMFKSKEASRNAYWIVGISISFLSGLLFPTYIFPGFLQHIGAIFHPYWLMRGLTSLFNYGFNTEFWLAQLVLVGFTVAFLLLGSRRRSI
jgi:ABC-2 type transport system permease protein